MRSHASAAGLASSLILALALSGCGGGGDSGDTTKPTVSSVSPAPDAVDVALVGEVTATFSEAMDCTTLDATSFTLKDERNYAVSGAVTCSETGATFTPDAPLDDGLLFTATVTSGAADTAANPLVANHTWSFTTRARAWGTEAALRTTTTSAYSPRVVFTPDGSGDALAVWYEEGPGGFDIWSSHYSIANGWSTPELVETADSNAYDVEIFMDAEGNAFALWLEGSDDSLWINRYTAGVGWGTESKLNEAGTVGYPAQLAFAPDGSAVAVWDQYLGGNNKVVARRYTVGGTWSATEAIDTAAVEGETRKFVSVAVDQDGNAVVLWGRGGLFDVWYNTYAPGTGWGAATLLENNAGQSLPARIAVDADGNFMALWRQNVDATTDELRARRYTAATGWAAEELLTTGAKNDYRPSLAFDAQGNAVAVWTTDGVSALHYTPASGWGVPVSIHTDNAQAVVQPKVAFDARGNATAVWTQGSQYATNRYRPGLGWGTAQFVGTNANNWEPASLALDAEGNALALWYSQSAPTQIMFNRFE